MGLDLTDPAAALEALLRARASLDGDETVTWFTGEVYGWTDGAHRHLFGLEGYNIARVQPADGGHDLMTREAVFYLDPQTRRPLRSWTNPYTEAEVPVVHIWNDPVNQPLRLDGPRGPLRLPHSVVGDHVTFQMDVLLAYPSPLPRAEFPMHSQDDTYHAAELFQFSCAKSDLEDESQLSVPATCSWTRIAPWLPFMGMGDHEGQLVYHCRGAKLPGGYAELPDWIREEVAATAPQYATAPTEITGPNATSWTEFRRLAESGEFPSTPERRDMTARPDTITITDADVAAGREGHHRIQNHHHRDVSGGAARAAVFGISDGLVSNVSLILAMAGGSAPSATVRLAGLAGLLAGAISMAAGEYVSMRAQTELLEREIDLERESLAQNRTAEQRELALIYASKGVSPRLATALAAEIHDDPQLALETHAREELGVDVESLGSATGAAVSSFGAFGVGALVPLLPWFFGAGAAAIITTLVLSCITAVAVGVALANFTGRSRFRSAARQLGIAVIAAVSTLLLGSLVGAGATAI